jgi:hypothetical protein
MASSDFHAIADEQTQFGNQVYTYSLLRQLSRSLVLAVSQQFDHTSLIRCETSNFLDDFADESGTFAEVTFSAGDTRLDLERSDFLDGALANASDRVSISGSMGGMPRSSWVKRVLLAFGSLVRSS